jgi:hypothetical protein
MFLDKLTSHRPPQNIIVPLIIESGQGLNILAYIQKK